MDDPVASAFRRHYEQVYRFLRRRTGSDEAAEDLAQAVFVTAAARLRQLEQDGPPVPAWLYTVARRRLIDSARESARRPGRIATLDEARAQAVEAAPAYGDRLSVSIASAVAALPEGQRQVVVLKLLVASEALYYLLGGSEAGLTVKRAPCEGGEHWWLEGRGDKLIDATADQFQDDFAYSEGVASKFLTSEPSPRAVKIILRIGAAGLTL